MRSAQLLVKGRAGLAAAVLFATACGGAAPDAVVEPREVAAASGAPTVAAVTDLGDYGPLPASGFELGQGDGDGTFVVGELILVRGEDFGKQPAVSVGGQPAEVLARTGDGAIVTRIPPAVPTGVTTVQVSHSGGKGGAEVEVTRFGLVVQPDAGRVHAVRVGADGTLGAAGSLQVPHARSVAYAPDGQVAYVAADGPDGTRRAELSVVALAASGGPEVVDVIELEHPRVEVVRTAARAPVGVVAGGGAVTVLDVTEPRYPSLGQRLDLGELGHAVVEAEVSPDGELAALLTDVDNRLVRLSLTGDGVRREEPVQLVPGARVPLVADLGFAPGGEEIWVVSGDGPVSLRVGLHPSALVRVVRSGAELIRSGGVEIADVEAPNALAVARRESTLGGTAIRSKSRRAVVVIADLHRGFVRSLAQGADAREELLKTPVAELGQLLRTDLEGVTRRLHTAEAVYSDVALTHDSRFAVAATTRVRREQGVLRLDFGVTLVPVEGGEARFVRLGDAVRADDLLAPGAVALSP